MEPLTNDLVMAVMASQDAVITELTRIVTERDAEINYITEQHQAMEKFILDQHRQLVRVKSSDEYESVQALYLERSQELQAAGYSNQLLGERVKQLEDIINDLRRDVDITSEERDDTAKTLVETENKVADLEEKNESQRQAMLIAEEKIIEQHALIQQLKQGNKDLLKDYKRRECTMAELKLEISELQYTKERIVSIEAENDRLVDEIKDFTIDRRETTLEINNMNTLINSQRQRLDELENAVSIYEHRFLAKGVDVPKLIARADEGERLWSKIEEREKRHKTITLFLGLLRDENTSLIRDKKKLQAEIEELKCCLEKNTVKGLNTSDDESQMPWLISQLRERVRLREKVAEMEDVISNGGYTVKAAQAEESYNKIKNKLAREVEELTEVIAMLKSQLGGVDDVKVPVVLGKLEEALLTVTKIADDPIPSKFEGAIFNMTKKDLASDVVLGVNIVHFDDEQNTLIACNDKQRTVSTVCSDISDNSKEGWEEGGGCFLWTDSICGTVRMDSTFATI